jgi:hypothetical protein
LILLCFFITGGPRFLHFFLNKKNLIQEYRQIYGL